MLGANPNIETLSPELRISDLGIGISREAGLVLDNILI
jgi:hypothetical protein